MTRPDAVKIAAQEAKARIGEYLSSIGIDTAAAKASKGVCPLCGSGTHKNKTGAFSLRETDHRWHCFSCGAGGDVFDLYAKVNGLDIKADAGKVFREVFSTLGISVDYKNSTKSKETESAKKMGKEPFSTEASNRFYQYVREAKKNIDNDDVVSYLQKRGISVELAKARGLGYDPNSRRLIFPLDGGGYQSRAIYDCESKDRYRRGGIAGLFCGEITINSNEPFYVVEGEIDALSVQMMGGKAVGLSSVANWRLVVQTVAELQKQSNKPIEGVSEVIWKKYTPKIIISLDADDAGKLATQDLYKGLLDLGVDVITQNIGRGHKDANEALCADKDAFGAALIKTGEEFSSLQDMARGAAESDYRINNSISAYRSSFENEINEDREYIHSGYPCLDFALSGMKSGGLPSGFYILGAMSSLGKTTYVLQMADQVAAAGSDVMIFSLEMKKTELVGKSLSRATFLLGVGVEEAKGNSNLVWERAKKNGVLTYYEVTDKRQMPTDLEKAGILNAAKSNYFDGIGLHIFIQEGGGLGRMKVSDIRNRVESHIKITGKKPLVIVDYLQILAAAEGHERDTDKAKLDENICELKKLQNDYGLAMIVVSSYNRESITNTSSMESMNGSGMIEYSADVVLSLSPDGFDNLKVEGKKNKVKNEIKTVKALSARPLVLEVLKNRNGRVGAKIKYIFYAPYNYFCEIGFDTKD